MNLKYLARVGATIMVILLVVGIVYYGVYLPYKWDLTGVVADANGVPVKNADVRLTMVGGEQEKKVEVEGEHKESGGALSTKTDDMGAYKFSSNILKQIQPGVYSINVTTMLSNGQPYSGYSGTIQLTGRNIKQKLIWTRSDEIELLNRYDSGLMFAAKQTRPDEGSKPSASASGVFWVRVDLTNFSSEYGIQIENSPGNNVSVNLMKGDLILMPGEDEINGSRVVDVDSRINGKYDKFLNTVVFAGFESAKVREGVYMLTASQREVIFAPITTGVLAKDVYDEKGNFVARSNYSDITIMSREYFNQYFEIVKIKVEAGQERIEYRCKDDKAVWDMFKASCAVTQHCENTVAKKHGYECSKGNL